MNDIFSLMPVEAINILNAIFAPLLAMDSNPTNPALTILIIAFIISLITNAANKYFGNQERVNEIQDKIKQFNDELMEAQKSNDSEKISRLEKEQPRIAKLQSEMMLNMFKPMLVTYLPIILIISWMRFSAVQGTVVILPQIVYWITLTPMWHYLGSIFYGGQATIAFGIGWFLWYFICSFGVNQIIKNFFAKKQGG